MSRPTTMKRLTVALLAFLYLVLTAGCGQSGPLYIPGNPSRIENPPPPAEEPADEEAAKENGDTNKG